MLIEVQCFFCGKKFQREVWLAKRFPHNFCCKECRNQWKSIKFRGKANPMYGRSGHESPTYKRVEYQCHYCGKKFLAWPCLKRKFCSTNCNVKWLQQKKGRLNHKWKDKIKCFCYMCGREVYLIPSRVKEKNFCSRNCQLEYLHESISGENNYYWKGGYDPYYGPNWGRQRRKALARDNYKCRICGSTHRRLIAHHIIPFREFGREKYEEANRLNNLISLCESHHLEYEKNVTYLKGLVTVIPRANHACDVTSGLDSVPDQCQPI